MEIPFKKYSQMTLLVASVVVIALNLGFGFLSVMAQLTRDKNDIVEPGIQYADLKKGLAGVREAGFLTSGNETAEGNDGQFMLAQYMLAPTVLDLNNSTHRYSVLDCANPQEALGILKIINAKPIYVNAFGKILAERNQ